MIHGKKIYNFTINGKRKIFYGRSLLPIQGRRFNKWSKRERYGTWFWTWQFDISEK